MSTKPHAFVAMPFGSKPGADGKLIDFNRVYGEFIAPALRRRLTVFRADQEMRAGDIRTDMFQELLVADLVVADLTIDNPERLVRARRAACAARARRRARLRRQGHDRLRPLHRPQAALRR